MFWALTYKLWDSMTGRCTKEKNKSFHRYGGGGVAIDPSWMRFENFFTDMGIRLEGKTLDRKGPDGNYCKLSTYKEQANNKFKL